MPALRRYIVELTQEIEVSSTNPADAAVLGVRAIKGEKKPEDQINVNSDIRETDLTIREKI